MNIKVAHDLQLGTTWVVRLIEQGGGYGLEDRVTHDGTEPLVEFFDPRYPHTDLGQFVARYNARTLLERAPAAALCLDMGSPSWTVSAAVMHQVHEWLQQRIRVAA